MLQSVLQLLNTNEKVVRSLASSVFSQLPYHTRHCDCVITLQPVLQIVSTFRLIPKPIFIHLFMLDQNRRSIFQHHSQTAPKGVFVDFEVSRGLSPCLHLCNVRIC